MAIITISRIFSTYQTEFHRLFVFSCLAYFTEHNVLEVHPCYSMTFLPGRSFWAFCVSALETLWAYPGQGFWTFCNRSGSWAVFGMFVFVFIFNTNRIHLGISQGLPCHPRDRHLWSWWAGIGWWRYRGADSQSEGGSRAGHAAAWSWGWPGPGSHATWALVW